MKVFFAKNSENKKCANATLQTENTQKKCQSNISASKCCQDKTSQNECCQSKTSAGLCVKKGFNKYDALIVGSGAAGYSTADWLIKYGVKNIAIITENRLVGTSRNTGSDKQTYYKISMVGSADSNMQMAQDLFDGGSMNGDIALIEASNSARCFLRLVEYGAPFPTNEYGEYIGYKTDHDNTARATSCGPLTSKFMTECLEKTVIKNGAKILDQMQAIKIVQQNNEVKGLIVLDSGGNLQFLQAKNIILATGGEASVYRDSVYPLGQTGATSLGIEAGAVLHNFQEWQYGMSATKFRWNVSGSYQQVVPKYVSVDKNGCEKEFLLDSLLPQDAYNLVFLKGYQWPFDYQKMASSSQIDLLVQQQIVQGNKVYLDFTANPSGYNFDALSNEAKQYLTEANCAEGMPFERLQKLNPQAIAVFKNHNIDLSKERLQIAICAQHNNGGLGIDSNWQTNVQGLFAVGEVAGTFGVYRQGGSALNSTQVGGLRVAQYLKNHNICSDKKATSADCSGNFTNKTVSHKSFVSDKNQNKTVATQKLESQIAKGCPTADNGAFDCSDFINAENKFIHQHIANTNNIAEVESHFKALMSEYGGAQRNYEKLQTILLELTAYLEGKNPLTISSKTQVKKLYKCWDMLICDCYLCKTMIESINNIGSRGGAVVFKGGKVVGEATEFKKKITVTSKNGVAFVDRKPIPTPNNNFETILNKGITNKSQTN
ncbi:MAG: FAD-binding protein [Clostridia bacterium]